MPQKIAVDLNVYDADGNVVDGTSSEMTAEQISKIVDAASELVLRARDGGDVAELIRGLDEALTRADVVEAPAPKPGG